MIKFDVLTLFPQLLKPHFSELPFKKAKELKKAQYNLWNLRDYALDSYGTVDNKSYGGGVGMVLMIEPVYKALCDIYGEDTMEKHVKGKGYLPKNTRIIALSPRGKTYNQNMARELSKYDQITLICGRYEGMDARIEQYLATDIISIGNFILSGGELPALTVMESISRLIPGVLEKEDAAKIESFSDKDSEKIEYPQYTRPEDFMGLKVPEVLLSGNHAEIEKWRDKNSTTQ
ncbi:MAG: tRNA (guanosine(37)-N1)-methyltransferase TrmD [Patescibacteria group bacterium]